MGMRLLRSSRLPINLRSSSLHVYREFHAISSNGLKRRLQCPLRCPLSLRCWSLRRRRPSALHLSPFVLAPLLPAPSHATAWFITSSSPPPNRKKSSDDPPSSEPSITDSKTLVRHWLKELRSPPNIITSLRIASAPLLSYLIVSQQYEYALCGCFLAGLSDVLDGHLAKHHSMSTVLGSYLDPLADKILINVVSVSLWYNDILPTALVGLWLTRDVLLMFGTYWYASQHTDRKTQYIMDPATVPLQVQPTPISKINTALQFLTLLVGLVEPLLPGEALVVVTAGGGCSYRVLHMLCWVTGGTTLASGWSYVGGASMIQANHSKLQEEMRRHAKEQTERIRRSLASTMNRSNKTMKKSSDKNSNSGRDRK